MNESMSEKRRGWNTEFLLSCVFVRAYCGLILFKYWLYLYIDIDIYILFDIEVHIIKTSRIMNMNIRLFIKSFQCTIYYLF